VDSSTVALASDDGLCGRKKLPFAGYSVVKESVEAFSAVRSRLSALGASASPSRARSGRASLQTWWPAPLLHASFCARRCHWPELSIVTSPTPKCKLKRQSLCAISPGCEVRLRPSGYGATAFVHVARLQRAGLPSPLPGQLRRAKAGGEYRARTGDLLVANQALSQLS
jgi:hypothetical protein